MQPLIIAALRRAPLFSALPDEPGGCFAALSLGADIRLAKGDLTQARAFHVVLSGALTIDGDHHVSTGDHFGAVALLAGTQSPTAVADAASRLLRLTPPLFDQMLDECPQIGRCLLGELADQFTKGRTQTC
jgi:CRP-like cAMP-binding protein